MEGRGPLRVGLVGSSGGHLDHLLALRPWWSKHDRFWVTFDTPDAREKLAGERWYPAYHPTTRSLVNLARNTALARRVLEAERPGLLVSSGAGVALRFFALGRRAGAALIWMEVMDRVRGPSLTGRLVGPLADRVVLPWEAQRQFYPTGVVVGPPW